MKNKKGISLIILAITIIVMIILAGIVIYNIAKNNPIEKAHIAALKTNLSAIYEDVNLYIMDNIDEDGNLSYPIKGNVPGELLNAGVRDAIAVYQNIYFNTGLPDIWNIDLKRVFYLDEKLVPTVLKYPGKIAMVFGDNDNWYLIHVDGLNYKDDIEYKIEAILYDINKPATLHATTYNTYKIYTDGTLKSIGQKNKVSGATQDEVDEIKYKDNVYKSPVKDTVKIESDYGTVAILDKHGVLWGYGQNYFRKLGTGTDYTVTIPIKLLDNVKDFQISRTSIWVLRNDGTYWVAGSGTEQYFGKNPGESSADKFVETIVDSTKVKKIYASEQATFVEYTNGEIWTTGYNYYGQLGTGDHKYYRTPFNLTEKLGMQGYKLFTAGYGNIAFVKPDNTIWASGNIDSSGEGNRTDWDVAVNRDLTKFIHKVPERYTPSQGGIKEIYQGQWNTTYVDNAGNIYRAIKGSDGFYKTGNSKTNIKYFVNESAFVTTDNNYYILNNNTREFVQQAKYKDKYQDVQGALITTTDGKQYIPNDIIINFRDKVSQLELKKIFNGKAKYVNGKGQTLFVVDTDYKFFTVSFGKQKDMKLDKVTKVFPEGFLLTSDKKLYKYNVNAGILGDLILENVVNFYPGGNNVAFTEDNKVYYWGNSHYWENVPTIPNRNPSQDISNPTLMNSTVYANGVIKEMAVRERDTSILFSNGKLFMCSSYWSAPGGEFGYVDLPSEVVKIVASNRNSFAILKDGSVYGWGENYKTMFGNGTEQGKWYTTPIKLKLNEKIVSAEVGDGYALFIADNGKVYGVGQNIYGQLGTGDFESTEVFVRCTELEQ